MTRKLQKCMAKTSLQRHLLLKTKLRIHSREKRDLRNDFSSLFFFFFFTTALMLAFLFLEMFKL